MEIKITFEGDITAFRLIEDGRSLNYNDLSRKEQEKICNALAAGHKLFVKFLKEEGKA